MAQGGEDRAAFRHKSAELAVAALFFVFGALVIYDSLRLGMGWQEVHGPRPGYFPFYIGLILCIAGAGTMYQALFGKKKNTDIFVDSEQLRRVLSVLVPALVYVLAVQLLGLYIASAVYIALFMVVLGKYSPLRSVSVGVLAMALFFLMFEVWFKVPLFKGMFDPLRFLGY